MFKNVLVVLAICFLSATVYAQDQGNQASKESVIELMKITGADRIGLALMQNYFPQIRKLNPNLPAAFWTTLVKEVNPDELLDQIVPVYQKNFSETEIREAINFYKSPVGKKFAKLRPKIKKDIGQIGDKWVKAVGDRALKKFKASEKNPAQPDKKPVKEKKPVK